MGKGQQKEEFNRRDLEERREKAKRMEPPHIDCYAMI
jgi:hypothetical protein